MAANGGMKWLSATVSLAITAISVYILRRKSSHFDEKVRELELALKASLDICAAERQGRIRSQQVTELPHSLFIYS